MYPEICKIGPVTIYSYGTMIVLAVVIACLIMAKDIHRFGLKRWVLFLFAVGSLLAGIIGGRILHVLLRLEYFSQHPAEIAAVNQGGFAIHGAFVLIVGFIYGFCKITKVKFVPFLDYMAPLFLLSHAIAKLGCFLNGCCFGREIWWGVYYNDQLLHPAQLYNVAGLMVAYCILLRYRKKSPPAGCVFVMFIIFEMAIRVLVDFASGPGNFAFSRYQVICLILLIISIYIHGRLQSRPRT